MATAKWVAARVRGSLSGLRSRHRASWPHKRSRGPVHTARNRIAEIGGQYQYHAFISYSRDPDERLARCLRQGLKNVAARWWEHERMRVFLDEAGLVPGDDLDGRLIAALDSSATLILLASKKSAASWWVRREVEYWQGLGRREVLIAHTGEGIVWSPSTADFDWDRTRALSREALGGAFTAYPAWVELATARRHPRLHAGIVQAGAAALAASILGVEKEALITRERRRQHARIATVTTTVIAVAAITVVSLLASSLATQEGEQAQLNVAQHLLAAADHASAVDQSLLLTVAAYRADPDSVARDRLVEEAALNPGLRRVLLVPAGGIGTVESVDYSQDGRLLAAAASSTPAGGSQDAAVVLWRGDGTGRPDQAVTSAAAFAASVAFSPDGRVIAVGDSSGGITLVMVTTGTVWPPRLTVGLRLGPPALPGSAEAGEVNRVSFAPDGRRLAASYGDGTTVVWQLATRKAVASFQGTASAFSPEGRTLASLEPEAGTVALRDARTLALLGTYSAGVAAPTDLAYRPDGKMIAVTSGTVSIASAVPTVAIVNLAARATHPINDTLGTGPVAYGSDDEVATDSELIPAASTVTSMPVYRSPRMTTRSIAFDPAGGLLAVGGSWTDGSGGDVMLMDTGTAALLPSTIMPPSGAATSSVEFPTSALSPDGRTLAVTGPGGVVKLLVAATGAPARPVLRPGVTSPARLTFSSDGTELAGVNGRQVTIWSLRDGVAHDFFFPIGLPGAEAGGLAFSPDGRLLAAGAPSGQIMLLRTTFPVTATTLAGGGAVCDLAFSPDGRYLAAATPSGAQLWDMASRQRAATLTAGGGSGASPEPVFVDGTNCTGTVAVSFVLGATKLAATDGRSVTIWTLPDGPRAALPQPLLNPAASLRPNPGYVIYTHLAASPDGDLLAAGTFGGAVFLWDMTTLRQVGPAMLSAPSVAAVGFGPGGNTVMSFGAFAMAWNIDPQYWLNWACDAVQRNLTAAEWNLYGTGPRIKECDQWPQ
jgi:WD40 repeat protein